MSLSAGSPPRPPDGVEVDETSDEVPGLVTVEESTTTEEEEEEEEEDSTRRRSDLAVLIATREEHPRLAERWGRADAAKADASWEGVTWDDDESGGAVVAELDLSGDDELTELPASLLGGLTRLTRLTLTDCHGLRTLPAEIGASTSLRRLDANHCHALTALPAEVGRLSRLEVLNLDHCSSLRGLPSSSLGGLTSLRSLRLTRCKNLAELPAEIGRLPRLTELRLSRCRSLADVPAMRSPVLERLDLTDCASLLRLPDHVGDLSSLTELNLTDCASLTGLPPDVGRLRSLRRLDLTDCASLTELPEEMGDLANLERLSLRGCESLTSLPDAVGRLSSLRSLILDGCAEMSSLPPSIGGLGALTRLGARYLPRLSVLPETVGGATSLTSLYLTGCEGLAWLPESVGRLTELTELDLTGCASLKGLPESLGCLTSLTTLDLKRCSSLTRLPASVGDLTALERLTLTDCSGLERIPLSVGRLGKLTTVDCARGCDSLTFPSSTVRRTDAADLLRVLRAVDDLLEGRFSGNYHVAADVRRCFFDDVLTDPSFARRLRRAVEVAPALLRWRDRDGRAAIDAAHRRCRRAMRQTAHFCGRYRLDRDATVADPGGRRGEEPVVLFAAAESEDGEFKRRVVLKAFPSGSSDRVAAEIEGRRGLAPDRATRLFAAWVDPDRVDEESIVALRESAAAVGAEAAARPGLAADVTRELRARPRDADDADDDDATTVTRAASVFGDDDDDDDDAVVFPFVLALDVPDRSLNEALAQNRVKLRDWDVLRRFGTDVAETLGELHEQGRVHGDLTPLNIAHVFFSWQLQNFDRSRAVGEPFGRVPPSTAFCPPEMARTLLDSSARRDDDDDDGSARLDASARVADPAHDLWSLGVVLFHLGSGKSLWQTDADGDVASGDLAVLSRWDKELCRLFLVGYARSDDPDTRALGNLVFRLLDPDPEQRKAHFPNGARSVVDHPFFDTTAAGNRKKSDLLVVDVVDPAASPPPPDKVSVSTTTTTTTVSRNESTNKTVPRFAFSARRVKKKKSFFRKRNSV